jgi:hypothetical protein
MRLAAFALFGVLLASAPGHAAPEGPKLALPIACTVGRTCEVQNYVDRDPGPGALDYRCGHRTYDGHKGVDIRVLDMAAQRAGVTVLAAAPGRVLRVRDGEPDISIRAPGAPSVAGKECGNGVVVDHGDGWNSQYCHMARGSLVVKPGDVVKAGDPLGKVGLSGDTEFPHLHFQMSRNGQVVDPFAPAPVAVGACAQQPPLWNAAAAAALSYRRGEVLNAGFAPGVVAQQAVEAGGVAPPSAASPAVAAYVRAINLELGDVIQFSLAGPDGKVLASNRSAPLDHDKAQYLSVIGRKQPAAGWPRGVYTADYQVLRQGKTALARRFDLRL